MQGLRVVEEVEAEVDEHAGRGSPVDLEMLLHEVEAAGTHEEHRRLSRQRVLLATLLERDGARDRVAQVHLAVEAVAIGGAVGVLEVRHEDVGARVQRVDDHLPVHRTGDLHAAVEDRSGQRGALPLTRADGSRLGEEAEQLARLQTRVALATRRQTLGHRGSEPAHQARDEGHTIDYVCSRAGRCAGTTPRGTRPQRSEGTRFDGFRGRTCMARACASSECRHGTRSSRTDRRCRCRPRSWHRCSDC